MITLTKLSGETIAEPTEQDIRSALAEAIANPEGESGFTPVQLKRDDGWMLTAYGSVLVILDHENGVDNLPSHIADSRQEDVEAVFVRFLQPGDNLSDFDWQLGYGPA